MHEILGYRVTTGIYENVLVSAAFFILDFLLLVLLLPTILRIMENLRWAPMRRALVEANLELIDQTFTSTSSIMTVFTSDGGHLGGNLRENLLWHVDRAGEIQDEMYETLDRFKDEVSFLSPAMEPSLAGPIVAIRRAVDDRNKTAGMMFKECLVYCHVEVRQDEDGSRFPILAPYPPDKKRLQEGLSEKVAQLHEQETAIRIASTALVRGVSLSIFQRWPMMNRLLQEILPFGRDGGGDLLEMLGGPVPRPPVDTFVQSKRAENLWTLSVREIIAEYRLEARRDLGMALSERHSVEWFNLANDRLRGARQEPEKQRSQTYVTTITLGAGSVDFAQRGGAYRSTSPSAASK